MDFLPNINNLGKTALLKRGKPLDKNLDFKFNMENMKEFYNHNLPHKM